MPKTPARSPLDAADQRLRRWRNSPLLRKRLPGGSHIFLIKKMDPFTYKMLSEQDKVNVFEQLVKANGWDKNLP